MKTGIIKHFEKVDEKMAKLAGEIELEDLVKADNYLSQLCREIMGQQLSGKVAVVIFERFKKLFDGEQIEAEAILNFSEGEIRAVGMAYSKVRSLKDLAGKIISGEVELKRFDDLPDQVVKEELVKVKGIGPWTAEMFLIFTLRRPDVFSPLDLGLRKGIQKLFGMEKMPTPIEAEEIAKKWSPYRSFACRLLWRSLNNQILV